MRLRDLTLQLSGNPSVPLALQVASALADAIRQGRLRPGDALPGTRTLAEELGVSRSTVVNAIHELEAEGWVESRVGSGTYVAVALPDQTPKAWGLRAPRDVASQEPGFDFPSLLSPPTEPMATLIDLRRSIPDARLAPSEALGKAYQRAIRLHGEKLLQLGEPKGNATLRRVLADMLSERRGLLVDPEQIVLTQGSRMAVELLSSALLPEGSAVAVEDPGRPALWDMFQRMSKLSLHPIAMDSEGLSVSELRALLKREPVRLLILSPRHQVPTTHSLSANRRVELLELAREHRIAVVELDEDCDYTYSARSDPPLASVDAFGQIIYYSSLSHLIAPSMHLGFLVAHRDLAEQLAKRCSMGDMRGDRVLEWSMAELIRDGELARHIRKVRRIYQQRRDHLVKALQGAFEKILVVDAPEGGLGLWLRLIAPVDTEAWLQACKGRNLLLQAGRHFSFRDESLPYLRLGFAHLDEKTLDEAVRRMKDAFETLNLI
jgi:GntR family transcriptional regulator / MocR family aminotransferase